MGVDPASQFLAAARFGEGVVAGAEDGDKQRCLEIASVITSNPAIEYHPKTGQWGP
jgi:hypothetical protein